MADSLVGASAVQIASNYEKYKEMFAKEASDSLTQADFLTLMVEQLKNQDFSNPTDNTEFIAQMAQFSALQAQTQSSFYASANYASSLIGKIVTVGSASTSGTVAEDKGVVDSVLMNGTEVTVVINGQQYKLDKVLTVENAYAVTSGIPDTGETDETEQTDESAENGENAEDDATVPSDEQSSD